MDRHKRDAGLFLSTSLWFLYLSRRPQPLAESSGGSSRTRLVASAYYGCRPGALQHARTVLAQQRDDEALVALAELRRDADKILAKGEVVTVTGKARLPPSGNGNDYASYAPYWWPDPESPTGVPHVRRDGEMNPDARDDSVSDSSRRIQLERTLRITGLAYFFTGEERYAEHALRQARCWFLDEATRMNPHLAYAQARRGSGGGVGIGDRCGIIEGRQIIQAADALALIEGAKGWREGERERIDAWLQQLLDWYLSSPQGTQENQAVNNHGSFFDEQVARLALCLEQQGLAQEVLERARQRRIATQVRGDGAMPQELSRADSLGYSLLNLQALCAIATLGEHVGLDIWSFSAEGGGSIGTAIDFVSPYIDPHIGQAWPFGQGGVGGRQRGIGELIPHLRMAALAMHKAEYEALACRLRESSSSGGKKFDSFLAACGERK